MRNDLRLSSLSIVLVVSLLALCGCAGSQSAALRTESYEDDRGSSGRDACESANLRRHRPGRNAGLSGSPSDRDNGGAEQAADRRVRPVGRILRENMPEFSPRNLSSMLSSDRITVLPAVSGLPCDFRIAVNILHFDIC